MRVTIKGRLTDDERGATLVIVALSLIAIFAMIVLTVDVGGLLLKRRALVNGSDAAALAAAQSCASTTDTANPEQVADTFAADNVAGLVPANGGITASSGCDSAANGFVTVQYSQQQQLFFAQVLGFGGSAPVTTTATAAWGPLGGGNAVPIVVDSGTLQGPCKIPDGAQIGDQCNLWYNNGFDTLGNGEWGFLNLDKWNVSSTFNCSSAGGASNRSKYIQNDFPSTLDLNGTPPGASPTYVCSDSGKATSNWSDLRSRIGDILLFPVNDCNGQLDKNGSVSPCPSNPDKYDIIGFVGLYLQDVLRGDDPAAIGSAGSSGTCSVANQTFTTGQSFNIATFGNANGCGVPSNHDPVPASAVHIFPKTGAEYVQCAVAGPGCAYVYDPGTQTITWVAAGVTRASFTFDWSVPASPGACGVRARDPNALCLVVQWKGFTTGPGPIGGQDFGARGIRLCDLAITGSCPQQ